MLYRVSKNRSVTCLRTADCNKDTAVGIDGITRTCLIIQMLCFLTVSKGE
jgi:hypothetical protein